MTNAYMFYRFHLNMIILFPSIWQNFFYRAKSHQHPLEASYDIIMTHFVDEPQLRWLLNVGFLWLWKDGKWKPYKPPSLPTLACFLYIYNEVSKVWKVIFFENKILKPLSSGEKLWINPRLNSFNSQYIVTFLKISKYYDSTCVSSYFHYLYVSFIHCKIR
jgi:hypothetical protein